MPNVDTSENEYVQYLEPVGRPCSCDACFKELGPDDKAVICPDCCAVFCEDCVRDGTYEGHDCEEYDEDDDG